jgi:hypothetical protein
VGRSDQSRQASAPHPSSPPFPPFTPLPARPLNLLLRLQVRTSRGHSPRHTSGAGATAAAATWQQRRRLGSGAGAEEHEGGGDPGPPGSREGPLSLHQAPLEHQAVQDIPSPRSSLDPLGCGVLQPPRAASPSPSLGEGGGVDWAVWGDAQLAQLAQEPANGQGLQAHALPHQQHHPQQQGGGDGLLGLVQPTEWVSFLHLPWPADAEVLVQVRGTRVFKAYF